jgi:hypothetical protein
MDTSINPKMIEFILKFSRIEYALKRSPEFSREDGIIKVPPGSMQKIHIAKADWHKFSEAIGNDFFEKRRICPNSKILWEKPAASWVIRTEGGKKILSWHDYSLKETHKNSFEPVKRVRNCIFHGESQEFIPRHSELVDASICVLDLALEHCRGDPSLSSIYDLYENSRPY